MGKLQVETRGDAVAIITDPKILKRISEQRREQNDAVYLRFLDEMKKSGADEDEVVARLADLFTEAWPNTPRWTPRRIRNLAAKRAGMSSMGSKAIAETKLISAVAELAKTAILASKNCDDELEELEDRQDEWVDIERTTNTGGKFGDSDSTKSLAIAEQRRKIEDRKLEIQSKFLTTVAALTGKNIVNINIDSAERRVSISDLDNEINELEQKIKLKGDDGGA